METALPTYNPEVARLWGNCSGFVSKICFPCLFAAVLRSNPPPATMKAGHVRGFAGGELLSISKKNSKEKTKNPT